MRVITMRHVALALLGVGLMAAFVPANADEPNPPSGEGITFQSDWGRFRPLSERDAARAKRRLDRAVERLHRRLVEDGSGGEAWKSYLRWNVVADELARPEPDLAGLDEVYSRLNAKHDGLELIWFADARQALHRYLNLRRGIGNPAIQSAYEKLLVGLPGRLDAYAKAPTPAEADAVGQIAAWLDDFGQGPEIVKLIRTRFRRPNVYIEVSRPLVAAGLTTPVDDTAPVRDCILGTTIRGTGRTTGDVAVEFSPSEEKAVINLVMSGTTESDNVGYNGPVRIHSRATTRLEGRKQLWIDAEGVSAAPSTAEATTQTTIQGLRAVRGGRMVEKIAWRRVWRDKARAEAIASRHAEARLDERIDEQADERIVEANGRFQERFYQPLWQRRILPNPLRFATTTEQLKVVGLTAAAGQLAAPDVPPAAAPGSDLSVRVHESMINNAAATILAGRTLDEEEFLRTMTDLLGEVPERFKAQGESWAIHFASREPFTVTFADGGMTMALRATGYSRGGSEHPGMDVRATYKIEQSDGQFVLVRQGDLWVFPPGFEPGRDRLSAKQQTIRRLLQDRFAKILEEKLTPKPALPLKDRWEKAGTLRMVHWTVAGGWMTLGWTLAKEK
ncbi:MAG: hypothetical protein JW809_09595 [Pirellulales bacterium]|nr:hypothetical protein [Pirellulales bacterium]